MNEHPRHIAENPELLADYVLGRVSGTQRAEIKSHLRSCAPCRESVDTELRLAAAAKRLGRDNLKRRLAARMREKAGFPVTRVLAVAASVVVLLGIGLVTRWVLLMNDGSAPAPTMTETKPAPVVRDELGESRQKTAELPRAQKEESAAREWKGRAASGERAGRFADELAVARERVDASGRIAPSVATETEAGAASAGFWTEGTNVETAAGAARLAAESVDQHKAVAKDERDKKSDGFAANSVQVQQQFVITQRPAADLPATQQLQRQRRNTIPTLIEERGGQTLMTLYLDTLLDGSELARARVEQRGEDSLVVRLQNQSIVYRFPQSRIRQQQTR